MSKKLIVGAIALFVVISVTIFTLAYTTEYNVTFNSDGGSSVETQTIKKGELITKPEDPTKEGFVFIGWYDEDGKEFDFSTKIDADITLTAKWVDENTTYTITFDSDGGTEIDSQEVKINGLVTKPKDPTKENLTFIGWYDENNRLFDFNTKVTSNITLVAHWSEEESNSTTTTRRANTTTRRTTTRATTTTTEANTSTTTQATISYKVTIEPINGDTFAPDYQLVIRLDGANVNNQFSSILSNGQTVLTKRNGIFFSNRNTLEAYLNTTLTAEKTNGEIINLSR